MLSSLNMSGASGKGSILGLTVGWRRLNPLEKAQYEERIQSLETDLALTKSCSPKRQFEYRHASEEGDPDLHSIVHHESLARSQLGTKPFCLEFCSL